MSGRVGAAGEVILDLILEESCGGKWSMIFNSFDLEKTCF